MTTADRPDRKARCARVRPQRARTPPVLCVPHLGDPDPATSIEVLAACAEAGAGVIELGLPFSDPSADGPSIQRAMERALAAAAALAARSTRSPRYAPGIATPIVLFGYYNPVFIMARRCSPRARAAAGVDAVLTVDLPIDELDELAVPARRAWRRGGAWWRDLDARSHRAARPVRPTLRSTTSRSKGVTGVKLAAPVEPERLAMIRAASGAPVAVGFGIRTAADAARFAAIATASWSARSSSTRSQGPAAEAPARVAAVVRELAAAMRRPD